MKIRAVKSKDGIYLHSEDIADLLFKWITTPIGANGREQAAKIVYNRVMKINKPRRAHTNVFVMKMFEVIPAIEL